MIKIALSMLLGVTAANLYPQPISIKLFVVINLIIAALRYKYKNLFLTCLMALLLGFSWMHYNLSAYNSKSLHPELYNKRINIIATVTGIPEIYPSKIKFIVKVNQAMSQPSLQGARLLLTSYKKALIIKPQPGDKLSLEVKLKPPHGFNNPGSFDIKQHMLIQRLTATGTVSPTSVKLIEKTTKLTDWPNIARENLGNSISNVVGQREISSVIKGLLIGERYEIPYRYWLSLQNTGLAHLFAISGLHIGLVALFGIVLARMLFFIKPVNWFRCELPVIESCFAIGLGFAYSALAGFAIPTVRALVMVTILAIGRIRKRNIKATDSLMLALIIILLLDPISILSISFWLTFVSMAIVLYIAQTDKITGIKGFLKFNLYISLGLFPITLFFFHKVSIIAPIMNLIALPFVGYIVLPLILLGAVFKFIYMPITILCWQLSASLLEYFITFINYCANFSFITFNNFHASTMALVFAFIGVIWLLAPRGFIGKPLAILCFLPLIFPIENILPENIAKITVLDVGQGLAVYVETKNHNLLYDTGPKFTKYTDAGNTIIVPYLRVINKNKLDKIIVSHPDLDHIGGAKSIMKKIPVNEVLISKKDNRVPSAGLCYGGQSWQWDGVLFEMLHPVKDKHYRKKNDSSCVLKITANNKSILLTGDIEKPIENKLVKKYKEKLQSDIMIVPHHGSLSSSSNKFIKTVNPKYAVVTSGFLNRYGHPKSRVLARYRRHGVKILDTVDHGAVSFTIGESFSS